MRTHHVDHARSSHVRFVFNEKVVSLNVAAAVTFGDVARTFDELSSERYGHPVMVDLTLGSLKAPSLCRAVCAA